METAPPAPPPRHKVAPERRAPTNGEAPETRRTPEPTNQERVRTAGVEDAAAEGVTAANEEPGACRGAEAAANEEPGACRGAEAAANEEPGAHRGAMAAANEEPGARRGAAAAANEEPGARRGTMAAANEEPGACKGAAAAANEEPGERRGPTALANEEPAAHRGAAAANGRSTVTNEQSAAAILGSTSANEEPGGGHRHSTEAVLGSTVANEQSAAAAVGLVSANEERGGAHGNATAAPLGSSSANEHSMSAILDSTAANEQSAAAALALSAANEQPGGAHRSAMAAILDSSSANERSTVAPLHSTTNEHSALATLHSPSANEQSTAAILDSSSTNEHSAAATLDSSSTNEHSAPAPLPSPSTNEHSAAAILDSPSTNEHSAAAPLPPPSTNEHSAAAILDSPSTNEHSAVAPLPPPSTNEQSAAATWDSSSTNEHAAPPASPREPAPAAPPLAALGGSLCSLGSGLDALSLRSYGDRSSGGSDSEGSSAAPPRADRFGFLGGSGSAECPVPVDVARQRELKWLEMLNHWDKWLLKRYQKVKLRCRKGIPSSLRARAWQLLSDSQSELEQHPGLFEELERQPGDPRWLDAIEKDLHRQFPFHEMFAARGGHGQQDLYRILKAYTVLRPHEGYCQAQAPVAAVLLMHMPAEQAFWCLVQICEKYLPGYYSAGLEALQLDAEVFGALLRRAAPGAHRHLRRFRVEPVLFLPEWFMCVFARSLPWAAVLRVWDMFFCEGVKVMFRVALVLLRQALGSAEQLRRCQGMYETMERLRSVPPPGLSEEALVSQVAALPLSAALLDRVARAQLRIWRETRGELARENPPRLHGARPIRMQRLLGAQPIRMQRPRGAEPAPGEGAEPPSPGGGALAGGGRGLMGRARLWGRGKGGRGEGEREGEEEGVGKGE